MPENDPPRAPEPIATAPEPAAPGSTTPAPTAPEPTAPAAAAPAAVPAAPEPTAPQAVPAAPGASGTHRLDAWSLRGLAHPLRMRLLSALRRNGPATASQLAAVLGESSGATSYHLRQLATHGFVREEPGRGTARERWWKAAHQGTDWELEEFTLHPDPSVRGAMDLFLRELANSHFEALSTWLGTLHEWPEDWRRAWDISDFSLRLTPERAAELGHELHALIRSYQDTDTTTTTTSTSAPVSASAPASGAKAETVRIQLHAFPRASG